MSFFGGGGSKNVLHYRCLSSLPLSPAPLSALGGFPSLAHSETSAIEAEISTPFPFHFVLIPLSPSHLILNLGLALRAPGAIKTPSGRQPSQDRAAAGSLMEDARHAQNSVLSIRGSEKLKGAPFDLLAGKLNS